MVTAAKKLKMLAPWKKTYDQPRQHIKKQRHYFANKGLSSQRYGCSGSTSADTCWPPGPWAPRCVPLPRLPGAPPLPTASTPLESHGSLEPQMPPPAPVPSLMGIILAPRQVPLDLEGTVHRVVPGPPWLRPGSSSSFLQQLSGGLGRWARLGLRALCTP